MTWVKICGTTNLEDALLAVKAGADALGFVFYEKSPRKVDVETAREIIAALPDRVEKVGVFVDQTAEQVREVVGRTGLSAVQMHGTATGSRISANEVDPCGVSKLIAVVQGDELMDGGFFISEAGKRKIYAILIDSGSDGTPGGTGKTFDWENARGMVRGIALNLPVIVAGGLNSSNVGEAMRMFQPWGVDVASGVESRPGKKDPGKVRAFVQAVRQAEKGA
jgi:phosphoribosylanthranilate isomerase